MANYTKNTIEARNFLEINGFKGLSFFQGKEFIYAFISERANKDYTWYEKDYSTFNECDKERMRFLKKELSFKEFKEYILKLIK